MKVLEHARHGATFLLNAPYGPDEVGITCRAASSSSFSTRGSTSG